jgi:hypothetical protein
MAAVLLIAGIGLLLAGLLAIGFGIPVKEFSFGNTLILVGAIAACTGAVMLGFWTVVRELKNIARRLGPDVAAESGTLPLADISAMQGSAISEEGGLLFTRDQPAPDVASTPWHDEAASRDRSRSDTRSAAEAAPAAKPRRNLLFSSTSRKERERAQARTAEPSASDLRPASGAAPPATFEDAWPKPERPTAVEAPARRSGRAPSTFTEASPGAAAADRIPSAARNEEPPPVTVLKSGVVDGMAYSLYSDGSIEAQMPEGMMRFASIDELRAHLDQRP